MPISLKPGQIKIKDNSGNYTNINILAEAATQEYLDAIEAKGEETIDSIPADYTALNNDVENLKDNIEQIKNSNSITLGKGTGDEVTMTAAQLKALLSLTSAEGVTF